MHVKGGFMPSIERVPASNITTGRDIQTDRGNELSRVSSGVGSSLSDLVKGQIFTGQITNISPNGLTLELKNGEFLTAEYNNLSDLSIGEAAKFKVIDNNNGKLILKALNTGNTLENAAYKALESLHLPFSSKNEELVTALLKNEYPVNSQMVNAMLQQSLKNPDISMTNLVLMNKIGLEITPETAKLFELFSDEQIKLTENIDKTFDCMLDLLDGLIAEGNIENSADISSKILKVLNLGIEPDVSITQNEANTPEVSDNTEFLDISKNLDTSSKFVRVLENLLNDVLESTPSNSINIKADTPVSEIFNLNQRLEVFSLFENVDIDVDAAKLQNLIKGELTASELLDLVKILPVSDALDPFVQLLTSEETLDKAIFSNIYQSKTITETAENIIELLDSNTVESNDKTALLKSPIFKKVLKSLIDTDFTLSAKELGNEHSVNTLYNRMYGQLNILNKIADTAGSNGVKLSAELNQAKSNMNFINEINRLFTFVQLPVRMDTQTATSDLYVYTNKKKKNPHDKDSISCLLHLDMKNLGGMNVRIELGKNNISTKFFLKNEDSGKLISAHLNELDAAFNKQGLASKSAVIKTTDEITEKKIKSGDFNLINDFIPSEINKNNFTRYTFDMRA